jgi:flagellar biosynthesis protein FlhB
LQIGSFLGKATANIIAEKTADFAWVYWTAVFMNVFTNVATLVFYFFTRYCNKRYRGTNDPATGEKLTESNKKFELKKALELPWTFWTIILFTAFQTSTAVVFSSNATELAERRFNVDSITAGWYSALSQYVGFFLVPILGVFIDLYGNRITVFAVCGTGVFLAMVLVTWGGTVSGTAASFAIYAISYTLGPTVIIDGIRSSMWYQEVFGSAYAIKIAVNNSMNIIIAILCGVIQDADDDSYARVVIVYVADAAAAVAVVVAMVVLSYLSVDMQILQWTRKQRTARGDLINERKQRALTGDLHVRNRKINKGFFGAVVVLILGAWSAYIWGAVTGNNY